ncbi:uncharacterized protein [Watersipora subatra]|uniref:uncharacterized protein n=1 Tax=Watersipora subatra TaxID=2589382 RepID=UPI00355AD2BA
MGSKVCAALVFVMALVAMTLGHQPSYQPSHQHTPHSYVVKYWSQWGSYGACSVTCGWGEQHRYRTCLSKTRYGYGNPVYSCSGPSYSRRRCHVGNPIDGGWSHWSSWATIQGYKKKRTRQCNYPPPSCGGRYCYGSSIEKKTSLHYPTPSLHYPTSSPHYPTPSPHYPTTSPHYPTPSPHYPKPSSHYPTPSPHYPTPSPHYPTPSPHYPTPSPHYPTPSPHYPTPSPHYPTPSPHYPTPSPHYPTPSPHYPTPSPY